MKKSVLFLFNLLSIATISAQPTAFVGCPNVNLAILRSGTNSAVTNPLSIYSVNTTTGLPSLLSGPILDPANASVNLQVNGLGLNTADGYLYGLYSNVPTIPLSFPVVPAFPYYRVGANAVAVQVGTLSGPAPVSPENASFVNSAAGELDQFGNYFFSAATGIGVPNFFNPLASTFTVTRLFIGKLANVSSLSGGVGALSPTYVQITNPSNDASVYLNSLATSVVLSTAQNTGLRDLVYNKFDNKLYTYVTFPDPLNPSGNYYGQMLKLNPSTGVLTALAPAVILPFATASNEVAGTLLDKSGNFLILFTDGKMYKASSTSIGVFDGAINLLNSATGLPTTLRGDMASCGATADGGTLPVTLSGFNVFKQNEGVTIKWQTAMEVGVDRFVVEKSTDAINWQTVSTIYTNNNSVNGANYQFVDKNASSTVYYRLVTVDKNGQAVYSSVKKITADAKAFSITTYPNPVKNTLIIEGQQAFGSATRVSISDVTGKILAVTSKSTADNMIKLDVTGLNKGIYFIRLINEAGQVSTNRFVKQ